MRVQLLPRLRVRLLASSQHAPAHRASELNGGLLLGLSEKN